VHNVGFCFFVNFITRKRYLSVPYKLSFLVMQVQLRQRVLYSFAMSTRMKNFSQLPYLRKLHDTVSNTPTNEYRKKSFLGFFSFSLSLFRFVFVMCVFFFFNYSSSYRAVKVIPDSSQCISFLLPQLILRTVDTTR